MFDGQYLFHNVAVYGPWMRRQGDGIRAIGELIAQNTGDVDVTVLTKATDESGDGTAVSGTLSLDTVGTVQSQEFTGLKDLVRYKFTATGTTAAHYALFRMLEPIWFDSV
jgi:hypothetical protein